MQPDERAADPSAPPEAVPPPPAPYQPVRTDPPEIPVVSWAWGWGKAIALGIRDTAQDMLDEGRKASREAYDEGWKDFDAKTRFRRKKP